MRTNTSRAEIARRVSGQLALVGLTVVVCVATWAALLEIWHLHSYFAKRPGDVWEFAVSGPDAASNRLLIWEPLSLTLARAALGYVAGTVGALVTAVVFVLSRTAERSLMPIAIALRSIPLVAITPLIVAIFGRDLLGVVVIAGLITFFPSLVLLAHGLRSASPRMIEVLLSYNASAWTVLTKVRLPSALPAFFAAARLAATGAIAGALVAEWLATGDGVGYAMLLAQHSSRFDYVWAAGVAVVVVSGALYSAIGALEGIVLSHYAPERMSAALTN